VGGPELAALRPFLAILLPSVPLYIIVLVNLSLSIKHYFYSNPEPRPTLQLATAQRTNSIFKIPHVLSFCQLPPASTTITNPSRIHIVVTS